MQQVRPISLEAKRAIHGVESDLHVEQDMGAAYRQMLL